MTKIYQVKRAYFYSTPEGFKEEVCAEVGIPVDIEEVYVEAERAIELMMSRWCSSDSSYINPKDVVKMVHEVKDSSTSDEIELALTRLAEKITPPGYNEKCNTVQPSNSLATTKQVKVLTDLCTNELQHEINAGWYIIAVQPQPNQRRPDYVLGRN